MEGFLKSENDYGKLINNSISYELLKTFVDNGLTIDGYDEMNKGFILKRINEIDSKDWILFDNSVYYKLEVPEKITKSNKKLIVKFSGHGASHDIKAIERYTGGVYQFNSLSKILEMDNVYVLRIADSTGNSGSFFQSTPINQKFEDEIQNLIKNISEENEINHQDIVLYGDSRGGTGAFLHGLIGNYKTLAIDPVVSNHFSSKDNYLTFNWMDGIIDKLNINISKSRDEVLRNITIITSDQSLGVYPFYQKLNLSSVRFLNVSENISENISFSYHAKYISKQLPLTLYFLKEKLNRKIEIGISGKTIDDWDVYPPHYVPKYYFNVHWSLENSSLLVSRNSNILVNDNKKTRWRTFFLKKNLTLGKKYKFSWKSSKNVQLYLYDAQWKFKKLHNSLALNINEEWVGVFITVSDIPEKFYKFEIYEIKIDEVNIDEVN